MGNRYSSVERRLWSKNIYSNTINPPNDFIISPIEISRLFLFPQESINKNSLIRLSHIGLFCNFADGLVYKLPDYKIECRIGALGFIKDIIFLPPDGKISGKLTINGNSEIVQGQSGVSIFLSELNVDNWILINSGTELDPLQYIYRIKEIINDYTLKVYNPTPLISAINTTGYKLRSTTGSVGFSYPFDIYQLNTMIPSEYILNPLTISDVKYDYLGILVYMRANNSISFLTKSIDTSYANDLCIFDIAIDIECTP